MTLMRYMSIDELEEVDIGDGNGKRPTYISTNLMISQRGEVCKVLKEFADNFAWDYTEMLGLSRELAEHQLPIKQGSGHISNPPGASTR
jgi:hypothetical protein